MQVQAVLEAISTALDAGLPAYLHKMSDEVISAIAGC
jgi:hypothetical protein